jgi:hypothetical protein
VLLAHADRPVALVTATIAHDHHLATRPDLVHPAVEQLDGGDIDRQFLANLAHDAHRRGFAGLEPAAGQLPFLALVLEQDDAVADENDSLHRHGKDRRLCFGRRGHGLVR